MKKVCGREIASFRQKRASPFMVAPFTALTEITLVALFMKQGRGYVAIINLPHLKYALNSIGNSGNNQFSRIGISLLNRILQQAKLQSTVGF
jgi:hypothetical protein